MKLASDVYLNHIIHPFKNIRCAVQSVTAGEHMKRLRVVAALSLGRWPLSPQHLGAFLVPSSAEMAQGVAAKGRWFRGNL